jgi:DNA polymerase-1
MRQGLSAPDGSGTWGIYGAFNVVANLVRRHQPTHVLIAFDKGRSAKRLAIDPEYKANRDRKRDPNKPMDQAFSVEFRPQLEIFKLLLHRSGVPFLSVQNVEADDIIATTALRNAATFEKVIIVSADHDLHQLIRPNIIVVKPSISYKDIDEEISDIESIVAEWGVEPWRLPEIWALMGDKGDNVKGIPGIGPKKATKLISDHGNLDAVLSLDDPKISDHIETVKKAKSLIELGIDEEVPFPPLGNLQFNPTRPDSPHAKLLEDLFDELGFVQLKDRWEHNTLWDEVISFGRRLK